MSSAPTRVFVGPWVEWVGRDRGWSYVGPLSTIVAMESRSLSRLRTLVGLMPMFGLAAVSCTIDADVNSNPPEIAADQSDSASGGGVRNTDGTTDGNGALTGTTDGNAGGGAGTDTAAANSAGGTDSAAASAGTDGTAGTQGGTDGTGSDTNTETMTTSDTSSDTTTACAKVEANFTAVIPTIYVLVDRSGSMKVGLPNMTTGVTESRWDVVKSTLVEEGDPADSATGGVVYRMQGKAKFALATYTSNGLTGTNCPNMAFSEAGAMPNELPKLNNWAGVKAQLDAAGPSGGTPSSEAIDWVWKKIKESDDPNRILVFASDGDPSYGTSGGVQIEGCTDYSFSADVASYNRYDRVVKVVEAMHADKIKTFVISVGSGASAARLNEVALAGVGVTDSMNTSDPNYPENPNQGATVDDDYFFAGTDSGLIQKAFESVITGARPCKFELEGRLNALGSNGEVKINGVEKVLNDPNGWKINSVTEIELVGDACKQVRSDPNVDLKVSFSCDVFQPG